MQEEKYEIDEEEKNKEFKAESVIKMLKSFLKYLNEEISRKTNSNLS